MDTYTQEVGGEATDSRRDIGGRGVGSAGSASAWSQRQPGVQLAQAVSSGATGKRRRGQAVASQHNPGKIADNRIIRLVTTVLAGYDSHPTPACASKDRGQCRCDVDAGLVGVFAAMIAPPSNTQIWIAAGVTDLRRGFTGLSALVQIKLEQSPLSGHVFVFRGRRGDLIKVLWFDGDGLCLFSKRLERGRFVWPQATSGSVALTRAQLSMLLEGIDWRRPERTWDPRAAV